MAMENYGEKRPVFGNRYLSDQSKVFQHNAWDNVEWTEEQEAEARKITIDHAENAMVEQDQAMYLSDAASQWDKFYEKHDNKFFKDRHWLFTEFPELLSAGLKTDLTMEHNVSRPKESTIPEPSSPLTLDTSSFSTQYELSHSAFPGSNHKLRYMEVGCGAGNTIFPLLHANCDPDLFVYACDYSRTAVDIVKSHRDYDASRCHAFVHDISSASQEFPVPKESLDVIVMIFVLSALEYKNVSSAVKRLVGLLKPGGLILLRDYGRYDMAQLRFKPKRCLSQNFYTRGDGTLVYFFTQEEIRNLFTGAGLIEKQNLVDRRLQVNRARQLKMYRVWVQAKYEKPLVLS